MKISFKPNLAKKKIKTQAGQSNSTEKVNFFGKTLQQKIRQMDQNQFERHFTCPICQQFALSAFEGQCCGLVICEACLNRCRTLSPNCPKCRKESYITRPSIRIRMIIENSLVDCRQECGRKIRFKERSSHQKFCQVAQRLFKNQETLYEFLRYFVSSWSSISYSLMKVNDVSSQNLRKLQIIYQNSIATILSSFSSVQKQKSPQHNDYRYWDFLIHQQTQYQQFMLNLILILYNNKKFVETIKHCLVLIQLPIHSNNIFFIFEILMFSVKGALLGKNDLQECYKQFSGYLEKLSSQNEGQFCAYLVCLNLLVKLAHVMKKNEEEEQFLVKLSLAESNAKKICFSDFKTVCWYVHVLNHVKQTPIVVGGKSKQELEKDIKESVYLIQYYFKNIILILQLVNDQNYIFTLLSEAPNIFSEEIYRIENSSLSAKFTEHFIINTIIEIFTSSQKNPEACFVDEVIRVGGEQEKLKFVYKLFCYELCHKKFNSFNQPNQICMDKLKSQMERLLILQIKNAKIFVENWEQIQRQDFNNFMQSLKKLKLPKQTMDKVEIQIVNLKQTLLNMLGQILFVIGQGKLNVKKQMLIRYLICKTFNDTGSDSLAGSMIKCLQMAFYSVVFLEDKLLESKQVKQCVQVVAKSIKDSFFFKIFETQYVNSARNRIGLFKVIKNMKQEQKSEIISNPERDQIFKSEYILEILQKFVGACEKVIVPSPRTIVKVKMEEPEKKPIKTKEPSKPKQIRNKK